MSTSYVFNLLVAARMRLAALRFKPYRQTVVQQLEKIEQSHLK